MTCQTNDTTAATHNTWVEQIQEVMAPHLHQIPYGNLRSELTQWDEAEGQVANLAIVYEVPGGSTNQINVTYYQSSGTFSYIGLDAQDERTTENLDEVLRMLTEVIARIPDIRKARLVEDIDRWAAQGLAQRELFQKMNKLLQIEDLRGGTITMIEMKYGIAHILAKYRAVNS